MTNFLKLTTTITVVLPAFKSVIIQLELPALQIHATYRHLLTKLKTKHADESRRRLRLKYCLWPNYQLSMGNTTCLMHEKLRFPSKLAIWSICRPQTARKFSSCHRLFGIWSEYRASIDISKSQKAGNGCSRTSRRETGQRNEWQTRRFGFSWSRKPWTRWQSESFPPKRKWRAHIPHRMVRAAGLLRFGAISAFWQFPRPIAPALIRVLDNGPKTLWSQRQIGHDDRHFPAGGLIPRLPFGETFPMLQWLTPSNEQGAAFESRSGINPSSNCWHRPASRFRVALSIVILIISSEVESRGAGTDGYSNSCGLPRAKNDMEFRAGQTA